MREERRAAATRSLVGETLSNAYRVIRLIGEGAMGGIYEARLIRLDKRVAIKVLARELAANSEALLRFHREAEITSQLGHPHIINVFDFGTTEHGQPYLVMEYLEGEDLANHLHRKKTLPLPAALRITKQVASALSETHAKGIVHRDLKPANLFIVRVQGEDFAKVLDFGISKVRAASTALTNASMLMGTPMYMAPEQAKGELELDHFTDQWALACITYEMLAGRPPFVGDDTAALLYQVVHEEPSRLSTFAMNLPPEVERVIRRALSKEPRERFPSVTVYARALEAAAAGEPAPADAAHWAGAGTPAAGLAPIDAGAAFAGGEQLFPPARRPRRGRLLLGAVAVAAVAGFLLVRARTSGPPPSAPGVVAAPAPAAGAAPAAAPPPAAEPTAAAQATPVSDDPAGAAADTESARTKAKIKTSTKTSTTTNKNESARRRPARRAAAAKTGTTAETPATSTPVKRKLINEL